jgi:hypothetical protein
MKELVFDANSWHYKFAHWAGYRPFGNRLDICCYMRRVLLGFLFVAGIFALISVAAYGLVQMFFGLIFSWIAGAWIMSLAGEITLFIISVLIGLFAFFTATEYLRVKLEERRDRRREERVNKPDGFIKHAYKSWKEKHCSKIKFVRDGEEVNGYME